MHVTVQSKQPARSGWPLLRAVQVMHLSEPSFHSSSCSGAKQQAGAFLIGPAFLLDLCYKIQSMSGYGGAPELPSSQVQYGKQITLCTREPNLLPYSYLLPAARVVRHYACPIVMRWRADDKRGRSKFKRGLDIVTHRQSSPYCSASLFEI